jgi:hypothetical protein
MKRSEAFSNKPKEVLEAIIIRKELVHYRLVIAS